MKTAKEVCEDIKNRDENNRLKRIDDAINKIIADVSLSGRITAVEYYANQSRIYDRTTGDIIVASCHFNSGPLYNDYYYNLNITGVEEKLIELGYKIERTKITVTGDITNEIYEDIPEKEFLGIIYRKAKRKRVRTEFDKQSKEANVITISACCGGE